jgi:hypothetical protein
MFSRSIEVRSAIYLPLAVDPGSANVILTDRFPRRTGGEADAYRVVAGYYSSFRE